MKHGFRVCPLVISKFAIEKQEQGVYFYDRMFFTVHIFTDQLYILFQTEIMEESPDLLTLGLLFGGDVDATSEDLPEVLSFQHKLIQEMVAAYYIAEQVQIDPSFLKIAFPTWEKVDEHREVVKFTCGLLAQNAAPLINYVAISMESKNTEESSVMQDLDIKDPYEFLETANPTSEKILEHEIKLDFMCKLLFESQTEATPLVNHVAQVYVREIWEELNQLATLPSYPTCHIIALRHLMKEKILIYNRFICGLAPNSVSNGGPN